VARHVELRRHTENDGDVLTPEGVQAALRVGSILDADYDLIVSSGAQRATQSAACMLAGSGRRVARGVVVDSRFRSSVEDRWRAAYEAAGAGDVGSFRKVDPDLVEKEAALLGAALRATFEALGEGERALVVGHSPMQEVAVYGLTGQIVEPLGKGGGIVVTEDEGRYRVEPAAPLAL
jgi:broad specificity phosphatase PhoE